MRIVRSFFKTFLFLFVFALIFLISTLTFLQTQTGKKWAKQKVLTVIEKQTHSKVEVESLQFEFPLNFQLKNLSFSKLDDQKQWLIIENFKLCCFYPSLLKGHLFFSKLQVTGLSLLDLPPVSNSPSISSQEDFLLPFYLQIKEIEIKKVKFSSSILDLLSLPPSLKKELKDSHLTLKGSFYNNPLMANLSTHLKIKINHDYTHEYFLKAAVDLENEQLTFNSTLPTVVLPYFPTLRSQAFIEGSAPLKVWQTIVFKNLADAQAIAGSIKIISCPISDSSFLSSLMGSKTFFQTNYLIHSMEAIDLKDFSLISPSLVLKGNTTLLKDQHLAKGAFEGEFKDLSPFQGWTKEKIEGSVYFEGEVDGPFISPLLSLKVQSPSLKWSDQLVESLEVQLKTKGENSSLSGLVQASFNYQQTPLQASFLIDCTDKQKLHLSAIEFHTPHTQVGGDIDYSLKNNLAEGVLKFSSNDLTDLSSFFGQTVQGQVKGQLKFSPHPEFFPLSQALSLDFTGQELEGEGGKVSHLQFSLYAQPLPTESVLEPFSSIFSIQTHFEAEAIEWKESQFLTCKGQTHHQLNWPQKTFSNLEVNLSATEIKSFDLFVKEAEGFLQVVGPLNHHLLSEGEGKLKATFKEIKKEEIEIEEIEGETQIQLATSLLSPFQVTVKGIKEKKGHLSTKGVWSQTPQKLFVRLDELQGEIENYPLNLYQPVEWVQTTEQKQLTPLRLIFGETELIADYKQKGEKIEGHLQAPSISTEALLLTGFSFPVTGKGSIQAELSGTFDQPVATGFIRLNTLQMKEKNFSRKNFLEGEIFFKTDLKGTQIKSKLYGIGKTPLHLSGDLPFSFSLSPFSIQTNAQTPLNIAVDAEEEIEPYLQLAGYDSINLIGQVKLALRLQGKIDALQIGGFASLSNGVYETNNTGTTYHHIQAYLQGAGSKLILKNFSAQDSKKGTLTGQGQLALNAKENFPFKFDVQLNQIFVVDADYATMDVSGPLTFMGTIKQPKVQGTLTVNQSVIQMEESLPTQVKTVEVTYINTPLGKASTAQLATQEKISPLALEIKLNIPGTLSIKGSKLSSTWKGSILVSGTPTALLLNGDLRINKGEFNLNGKVFNLSQGTIHFAGSPSKKTSLYVVASKDIDRIRAEIILKGTLTKPLITFRSNPPLPQREVLSYILFNRGLSNITSDQGEKLSQSFIELSTTGQKSNHDDFLTRLRNKGVIDRLDLTRGQEENFSLQVGKYITEGICVSVNKGINGLDASNHIAIEAELIKNIKAEIEVGLKEETPIRTSIKWHKDY